MKWLKKNPYKLKSYIPYTEQCAKSLGNFKVDSLKIAKRSISLRRNRIIFIFVIQGKLNTFIEFFRCNVARPTHFLIIMIDIQGK